MNPVRIVWDATIETERLVMDPGDPEYGSPADLPAFCAGIVERLSSHHAAVG